MTNILPGLHLSVHRDITERKRRRRPYARARHGSASLIESIPHMVWTAHRDGYGDYHNARFLDYVGVEPEQLKAMAGPRCSTPTIASVPLTPGTCRAADEAEYRIEFRFRNGKSGEYRWFLTTPYPSGTMTAKSCAGSAPAQISMSAMRADEAQRNSEERLRQLVALMPAAVYTCDLEGRITSSIVGLSSSGAANPDRKTGICGAFRLCRMDGTPLPHVQTPMAKCVQEGRLSQRRANLGRASDGTRAVVSVNVAPLLDGQGCRVGAINVFEDITERKRAETSLARFDGALAGPFPSRGRSAGGRASASCP